MRSEGKQSQPHDEPSQDALRRFDDNLRRISVALFGVGLLVVLLVANTEFGHTSYAVNQVALNLVGVAVAIAIVGVLLFPWHRYNRNLFVIASVGGICLIAVSIYFSGGWESPFFPLYFFVVVFAALYYAPRLAVLIVLLTAFASVSPQFYEPDAPRFAQHVAVDFPSYLAVALVSWYMTREIGRRELLRGESERQLGEMRQHRDHFRQAAYTDRLTGLPNRSRFEERLQDEVKRARRQEQEFALVFLDMDDFKLVNDTRGHRAGDEALKLIAEVLHLNTREIDLPARHGGEEFTALLVGTSLEGAQDFFERVRDEVAYHGERKLDLTLRLSGGVAVFPRDADDPDDLLEAADKAMYEAKHQGKGRLYHPDLEAN